MTKDQSRAELNPYDPPHTPLSDSSVKPGNLGGTLLIGLGVCAVLASLPLGLFALTESIRSAPSPAKYGFFVVALELAAVGISTIIHGARRSQTSQHAMVAALIAFVATIALVARLAGP